MNKLLLAQCLTTLGGLNPLVCAIEGDAPAGGGGLAPEPKAAAAEAAAALGEPGAAAADPTPTAATPAPEGEAALPPSAAAGPRVVTLPPDALARIRREERDRGERETRLALDDQAKGAGFDSYDEMVEAAREASAARAAAEATKAAASAEAPADPTETPAERKLRQQLEREQTRARELGGKVAQAEAAALSLQEKLDTQKAQNDLMSSAVRAGCQDPDYAVELLRRKLAGKSEEELRGFSEDVFFAQELKKTHPYLYQPQQVPATTGAGGKEGAAPAAKSPGAVSKADADAGRTDARSMPREDYDALLKRHGLTNPTTGLSH